jgi:hypothetical protein
LADLQGTLKSENNTTPQIPYVYDYITNLKETAVLFAAAASAATASAAASSCATARHQAETANTRGEYKANSNCRRMPSSGMLRRVDLVRTDVSEELSASIIKLTRIGELGTTSVARYG